MDYLAPIPLPARPGLGSAHRPRLSGMWQDSGMLPGLPGGQDLSRSGLTDDKNVRPRWFGPGHQPEGLHAGQATKRNCTTTHIFTIAWTPDPTFKASETNLQPNLLIFLASLPEKTSGRAFWSSAASFMNADSITMRAITPFQHTPPTHAGLNNTDGSGPVWESFGQLTELSLPAYVRWSCVIMPYKPHHLDFWEA